MPRLLALFFIFLMVSMSACRCPPDEEVGTLSLSPEALGFLPYSGSEALTFARADGQELTFTAPRGEQLGTDQVCVRTICTEARYNSPSSCEFYTTGNRRYVFVSDDNRHLIDLLLYSALHEEDTENFYDALQVGYSAGAPAIQGNTAIVPRFNGGFVASEVPFSSPLLKVSTVELNGRQYTDVLRRAEGNLSIYLQPGKGVIAISENGNVYTLVE